jgi:hypothetical protein
MLPRLRITPVSQSPSLQPLAFLLTVIPGTRGYGDHGPGGQGGPPPAQYNAEPPRPSYQPPSDKPPLPSGWQPIFDQQHQRWYYLETATGRTQWEVPGYGSAPPPPSGHEGSRGYGDHGSQGGYPGSHGYGSSGYGDHGGHGADYGGHDGNRGDYGGHGGPGYGGHGGPGYGGQGDHGYGGGHNPYPHGGEEKSSKSGMLMGAAGGLAVGAVGGALVANALDDDDETHNHYYGAPAGGAPPAEYGAPPTDPYGDAPPAVLPPTDADGDSVSSGDREDVQEAREDYEEALADAQDSDASSSDHEEAQEAYEEYQEQYEETYED